VQQSLEPATAYLLHAVHTAAREIPLPDFSARPGAKCHRDRIVMTGTRQAKNRRNQPGQQAGEAQPDLCGLADALLGVRELTAENLAGILAAGRQCRRDVAQREAEAA